MPARIAREEHVPHSPHSPHPSHGSEGSAWLAVAFIAFFAGSAMLGAKTRLGRWVGGIVFVPSGLLFAVIVGTFVYGIYQANFR